MIKILHSADWHLGAPLLGHEELRQELMKIPEKLTALCRREGCQLVLLSGDLFDGGYTRESLQILCSALEEMAVPVFICPGNHDFVSGQSPWLTETFPANVHIFTRQAIESCDLPELGCRVYGAGFTAMDCPALLQDFCADAGRINIGVLHGDPTVAASPYNPISRAQVEQSNLDYLALGHIHQSGSFSAGKTLCAWPGCPMGKGYDEEGEKGALIVTIDDGVSARFVPLDTPRFYDLQSEVSGLDALLPAVGSADYYRITLTGEAENMDLDSLYKKFARFPNLRLRDKTVAPLDIWGSAGADSFEGVYFGLLKQALDAAEEDQKEEILLAAKLSRQLLEGQEVVLP
jgi:DNA repair exonuclease SbcCD nuclease subunit